MNFLIVTSMDLNGAGGLQTRYYELSRTLANMAHKVFLVGAIYKKDYSLAAPGVSVYPVNMLAIEKVKFLMTTGVLGQGLWSILFTLKCFVACFKICFSQKIDVCITYTAISDPAIYLVCHIFCVPWIYDCRGLKERELATTKVMSSSLLPLELAVDRFSSRFSNKILAVSDDMKKNIVWLRGVPPSHVAVSEDGFDPAALNPKVPRGMNDVYRASPDAPIVLYVGAVSPTKGIDKLIMAMPHVRDKIPDAKLVVAGMGTYVVDASDELKILVENLSANEYIVFTGRVPQTAPYIVDADVCVAPSPLFFSPVKVYEYLACARPVILSKEVDIARRLTAINGALAVDTTDPHELASAIIRLLSDKELSQKIASNGYRFVSDKFTWQLISERLVDMVKSELIKEPKC